MKASINQGSIFSLCVSVLLLMGQLYEELTI